MSPDGDPGSFGARCYCGAVGLRMRGLVTVAYCHCSDCKRWTGAPAPAFAAFAEGGLEWHRAKPEQRGFAPGVTRWHCGACGSAMAARFDYLPGQVYVPLGVIDQMDDLPPRLHCHAQGRAAWLDEALGLPMHDDSARDALNGG